MASSGLKPDLIAPQKKREEKANEKQSNSIQQVLLKSLGPEQRESPICGPLRSSLGPIDRRKFSLDMDYKEKVRN